ncbi:MAG: phosphoenolpyruvate synthase, partial [Methanomicrobiales archaeon]|nr:phosphoenolpyruvate synthase [Methanomicrobiales archaeon]
MEASLRNAPNILTLEEITKDDIPLVGGKGASLGEMTTIGLPVPPAFVVTAQAYRKFLVESSIEEELFGKLEGIDIEKTDVLEKASATAKELILKTPMPNYLKTEIKKAYQAMGKNVVVAVRSSATAEDLPGASFAGQQETFLNIVGFDDLLEAVQKCWASLFTPRAIYYRSRQGFQDRQVNIAVVVQQMIPAEKAGVMFTSHPVTGEPETIVEGSWGLGEAIVSGTVSPDKYVYNRRKGKVVDRVIGTKKIAIVPDGKKGTKEVELSREKQEGQALSEDEVRNLAEFGKIAEEHYGSPQDVEWAIVKDQIYILQSRPITTIKTQDIPEKEAAVNETEGEGKILIQGQGASPGVASGSVVMVMNMKDVGKVQGGDIMVTRMTNPDMVPAMRKVAGIVTDEGGMTCHAAIVSRELGTPAVVGTKKATTILKEGQLVTIDGEKGFVYEGGLATGVQRAGMATERTTVAAAPLITATLVKVNVSLPEAAVRAAATGADGVGLLRIEHLILGLNKTPGWYIQNRREEEFI